MLWEMGHGLVGSSIRRMAPATQAADRRMTNSKPSLETRVTYSEGWEVIVEIENEVVKRYSTLVLPGAFARLERRAPSLSNL